MGELVKNAELECKVAAEGFDGLLWTPFSKGRLPSNRVSRYLLRVVWGEWLCSGGQVWGQRQQRTVKARKDG